MSLITAVVFLIATIITVVGELPWWVVLVAVLLFVGSVAPTLYKRISTAIDKRKHKRHQQNIVQQHWGELRRLATELHHMTESSRIEVPSTISDMAKTVLLDDKQEYYRPHHYKYSLNAVVATFLSLLDLQVRDRNTFLSSAQLLGHLTRFWHDLSMRMVTNLTKDLQTTDWKLNSKQKQDYNKVREWHTDLMDAYIKFAKTANADLSEEVVLLTTYEPLPDL